MEKINYIAHAISAAIHLLNNEIQCVEDEELITEKRNGGIGSTDKED